jgi:hypothetical protein
MDEYVSVQPYCAMLNNSIWLIDINGESIWIGYYGMRKRKLDDPNNIGLTYVWEENPDPIALVEYRDGILYNEKGEEIQLKKWKGKKVYSKSHQRL